MMALSSPLINSLSISMIIICIIYLEYCNFKYYYRFFCIIIIILGTNILFIFFVNVFVFFFRFWLIISLEETISEGINIL